LQIHFAVDRLSHGNGAERAREPGNLRARDLDAVKQRLEARIPGGMGGHERTADRASLSAEIEPELGQHAAYAPRLCIVILRIEPTIADWRCSRRSREASKRSITLPTPPALLAKMPMRDSPPRSNGMTMAPLSRAGFCTFVRDSPLEPPRDGCLIVPAMSPRPLSAPARDSNAACRRRICSSFFSYAS